MKAGYSPAPVRRRMNQRSAAIEQVPFSATVRAILKEGGIPLAVLMVLALALKITYQFDNQHHNPVAAHPVSDELLYIQWAGEVAEI